MYFTIRKEQHVPKTIFDSLTTFYKKTNQPVQNSNSH